MKRVSTILILAWLTVLSVSAQKGAIGSRAPQIAPVEWVSDQPELKGRAMMVEFFHSSNSVCRERTAHCNLLASLYADRLNLVIVTREPEEQIASLLFKEYQYYYIAVDDSGSVFRAYAVPYVPYAVVADRRGVIRWTGNPQTLTDEIIASIIE